MAIRERKLRRLSLYAPVLAWVCEQLIRKKLLDFIVAQEGAIFHQGLLV